MDIDETYLTFYREWLLLPKEQFRILALLADLEIFEGNLTDLCRRFSLTPQSRNRNKLKEAIEALTDIRFIESRKAGQKYTLRIIPKVDTINVGRRWVRPIMRREYKREGISWESVLKVFILICGSHGHGITSHSEMAYELGLSRSTVSEAEHVLRDELNAIVTETYKVEVNGEYRNIGHDVSAVAIWSY